MKNWKTFLIKLFFVPIWLVILFSIVTAVALVAIFLNGLENTIIAYLMYGFINAISGIIYRTYWFGIFAVYYAIMAVMRFLLVRYVRENEILYYNYSNN